jgi:hypothetical protein
MRSNQVNYDLVSSESQHKQTLNEYFNDNDSLTEAEKSKNL